MNKFKKFTVLFFVLLVLALALFFVFGGGFSVSDGGLVVDSFVDSVDVDVDGFDCVDGELVERVVPGRSGVFG